MSDSIRISLSKTNALRFAERATQLAALQAAQNQDVTVLLADACEPEVFQAVLQNSWPFAITATEIVFSPPPSTLALVPDDAQGTGA